MHLQHLFIYINVGFMSILGRCGHDRTVVGLK